MAAMLGQIAGSEATKSPAQPGMQNQQGSAGGQQGAGQQQQMYQNPFNFSGQQAPSPQMMQQGTRQAMPGAGQQAQQQQGGGGMSLMNILNMLGGM